ncbi:acetyl esterase/lipase [Arthrobacter sp. AG367]|uniref:alpha/beta hydrolase n=1 Tax=Arthrobacter sp. AG367 TaxID=2572909 RepID=UPI0011A6260E|nr:alpha/beta hydrolase [Arthrobacter sp. AG367]TWD47067.1 acetyl esterase/lipase [Arthrobacter sp. AG367]
MRRTAFGSFRNQSDLSVVANLPTTPPDVRIMYDPHPLTFGDLRLPDTENREPLHPLVILIHGGAWESSFSLGYMEQLAELFTQAGIATWNIEFRRLNNPGGGYPGTFLDVGRGIDYATQLAQDYPIDLNHVVLLGHSSGGHLATWAAGRKRIPKGSELFVQNPLNVSGVVDLAGVLDLGCAYRAGREDVRQILGAADLDEIMDKARTASSISLLPMGVPQTLIIGSKDNPWRLESHGRYHDIGTGAGDKIDLVTLEGANHFDVLDPSGPAWTEIVQAVFNYLGMRVSPDVLGLGARTHTTGAPASRPEVRTQAPIV